MSGEACGALCWYAIVTSLIMAMKERKINVSCMWS